MALLNSFLAFGLLAAQVLALALPSASTIKRDDLETNDPDPHYVNPKPSKDPWYKPPDGWEQEAPGTVLGVRDHAFKGPAGFSGYYDVLQILFRTTDSHMRPNYAATTVFLPDSHKKCAETFRNTSNPANCSHQLVSYQLPYDSSCFDASPSWGLQGGEPYGDMQVMLERGYLVSSPDYEASRASYGACVLAGYTVLDQFRALQATLGDYGFRTNSSRFALWGYSSGGTASEFAAELAATYAPDVHLAGAVLGGITANMSASLQLVNGRDTAGLLVNALIGLTREYPEQRAFLDAQLKKEGPYNSSEFYQAQTIVGREGLGRYLYQNIYEYFQNGRDDVFAPTMLGPMNNEGLAGFHGTPNMPVFYYHAINDEVCPIEYVDAVVKRHCDGGGTIWLQRNTIGNHNLEGTNGRQRGLDFLGDVLDGTRVTGRPEKGCVVENVTWEQNDKVPFH